MTAYDQATQALRETPRTWLITGVAGFIGSHLLEALLKLDQRIAGLDNFSTGNQHNLDDVRSAVTAEQWSRFEFIEGDIRNLETCRRACQDIEIVLHHAALGSVPRSIADPISTHECNVGGILNMLIAARDEEVERFVYASSSSVYGDHPGLPKVEDAIGRPLSPYAATKLASEQYAGVFSRCYGLRTIGLRYFNVFGPRQNPHGEYAAVIPRWIAAIASSEPVTIFGDGETSRDFCPVECAVQACILAATADNNDALDEVYNIALGGRTTLNELFEMIRRAIERESRRPVDAQPVYAEFRPGDVRHSRADIGRARRLLGYEPPKSIEGPLIAMVRSMMAGAASG